MVRPRDATVVMTLPCQNGAGPPCELRRWDHRWSSLWGHGTCEGCAKIGQGRHASSATGTI
eukprot:4179642-Pyramimonas_sp.AAC.1